MVPEFEFPVILAPLRDLTKSNAQIQPTIDLFLNLEVGPHAHMRDAAISIKPMVLDLEDRHLLYIASLADGLAKAVYTPPILEPRMFISFSFPLFFSTNNSH